MTTRTPRQHSLDRALARILAQTRGYPCAENILRAQVCCEVVPPPTASEIDDSIAYMDEQRRIQGITTEIGRKWQLSELGEIWRTSNR